MLFEIFRQLHFRENGHARSWPIIIAQRWPSLICCLWHWNWSVEDLDCSQPRWYRSLHSCWRSCRKQTKTSRRILCGQPRRAQRHPLSNRCGAGNLSSCPNDYLYINSLSYKLKYWQQYFAQHPNLFFVNIKAVILRKLPKSLLNKNIQSLLGQIRAISHSLCNKISLKTKRQARCQDSQSKEPTIFALLIAMTCSLGFAGEALAGGKGGSSADEQKVQAYLINVLGGA